MIILLIGNLNFQIKGFVPSISHRAAVGSQCATSKNVKAGEIIYIRLRDSYRISHVLVYGGVTTMDGIEVRAYTILNQPKSYFLKY